jgi:hypothetical protein
MLVRIMNAALDTFRASRVWRIAVVASAVGLLSPLHVLGQSDVDLAALIECRADPRDWGGLAFTLMGDPDTPAALGWISVMSDNPFLQEYDLASPITVFGLEASRIALTATGPLAVLAGIDVEPFAARLGVTAGAVSSAEFLGERVVLDEVDDSDGTKFRTRVSINVSTVASHPGVVLAGCSYVIEMVDG